MSAGMPGATHLVNGLSAMSSHLATAAAADCRQLVVRASREEPRASTLAPDSKDGVSQGSGGFPGPGNHCTASAPPRPSRLPDAAHEQLDAIRQEHMIDLEVSVSASRRPAGHANPVANREPIARQPPAALRADRAAFEGPHRLHALRVGAVTSRQDVRVLPRDPRHHAFHFRDDVAIEFGHRMMRGG